MTFDLATAVRATGARVFRFSPSGEAIEGHLHAADLAVPLGEVVIDSRQASPGCLFVALPGDRVDGNEFATAALARGAVACLVSRLPTGTAARSRDALPGSNYLLLVPDPLLALQRLARHWRDRSEAEVIGITGSIGKTTTKEIVASVLGHARPVLKNVGNLNTEIGLPLTLLRLRPEHRAAVLEMGMYVPGDIALLATIARPRIGIVTNVEPVHLERAGSIERIAAAKSELVAALPPDGLAILNGDDSWTRAMAGSGGVARALLIGTAPDCDFRAEEVVDRGLDGMAVAVRAGGELHWLETSIPGTHLAQAFLAAAAVGRELDISWSQLQAGAAAARLDVRQRVIRDRAGMLIIDDTYNAAPRSMRAALGLLRQAPGTKIAALGDMLELGPGEEQAHREIGALAAGIVDWLVVFGSRAGWIAEAAEQSGLAARRIVRAESNEDTARAIEEIVSRAPVASGARATDSRAGTRAAPRMPANQQIDWSVLVKGSRGMEMEQTVERIRGSL